MPMMPRGGSVPKLITAIRVFTDFRDNEIPKLEFSLNEAVKERYGLPPEKQFPKKTLKNIQDRLKKINRLSLECIALLRINT